VAQNSLPARTLARQCYARSRTHTPPGDFNLWFLEQTINSSEITFIGCCNELNASYAADGCARLTNISALVTTYGVGELAVLS